MNNALKDARPNDGRQAEAIDILLIVLSTFTGPVLFNFGFEATLA